MPQDERSTQAAQSSQVQAILDSAQDRMKNAQCLIYSGPAGARVLQSLVAVLARQLLTIEQQRQIEDLLTVYEDCLSRNGQVKQRC